MLQQFFKSGETRQMITVTRLRNDAMAHRVDAGGHSFVVDIPVADGSPDPHDLYDAALGACKATTMVWYANRRGWRCAMSR